MIKRRTSVTAVVAGLLFSIASGLVYVSLYAATVNAQVTHLQAREGEDREAAKADRLTRQTEDLAIRAAALKQQQADAKIHERLTRSTTRIETHLEIIANVNKRRRR